MEVGAKFIGMVKTNTKRLCKENIERVTKDCPGGSYLMFRSKPMVPRDRPLNAIGYKYIVQKVLSYIVTNNTGSTNIGIHYVSKYHDQYTNAAIRPVFVLLLCQK